MRKTRLDFIKHLFQRYFGEFNGIFDFFIQPLFYIFFLQSYIITTNICSCANCYTVHTRYSYIQSYIMLALIISDEMFLF